MVPLVVGVADPGGSEQDQPLVSRLWPGGSVQGVGGLGGLTLHVVVGLVGVVVCLPLLLVPSGKDGAGVHGLVVIPVVEGVGRAAGTAAAHQLAVAVESCNVMMELQQLNDSLEQQVRDRTQELSLAL